MCPDTGSTIASIMPSIEKVSSSSFTCSMTSSLQQPERVATSAVTSSTSLRLESHRDIPPLSRISRRILRAPMVVSPTVRVREQEQESPNLISCSMTDEIEARCWLEILWNQINCFVFSFQFYNLYNSPYGIISSHQCPLIEPRDFCFFEFNQYFIHNHHFFNFYL